MKHLSAISAWVGLQANSDDVFMWLDGVLSNDENTKWSANVKDYLESDKFGAIITHPSFAMVRFGCDELFRVLCEV